MKPIKFLEPEIAEKIEEIISHYKIEDPIIKLIKLKRIFDKNTTYVYDIDEHNFQNIYDKHYNKIKDIIENHPEQLLLHFATYDPQIPSHAAFVTPILENFDCITYIRKHRDLDPTAVASVLKRKDSDIEFDLTLVDTYELDIDKSKEPYIKSYLYGNPYDEDWEYVQKTNFSDINNVIKNNE